MNIVGYEILNIEKEQGFLVEKTQSIFEEWLGWSKKTLKIPENPSRQSVVSLLREIDIRFSTSGYRFISDSPLFYESLQLKRINCNGYSTMYFSIGQHLNLPIKLVNAPNHVFCKWQFSDGTHLNWETTNGGRELRDEHYINELKINQEAIKKGVFLSSLNEDDIIANWHLLHGRYWNNMSEHQKALNCYLKTIKLSPLMAEAYHNLATTYFVLGNKDEAFKYIDKAIDLNPGNELAVETKKIMAE